MTDKVNPTVTAGPVRSVADMERVAMTAPDASKKPAVPESGAIDMGSLFRLAVVEKLPIEQMRELFALSQSMRRDQAERDFHEAFARFRQAIKPVKHNREKAKDATKSGGNFSYTWADLPAISRHVDEPLAVEGFSYSWTDAVVNGQLMTASCVLRHRGGHSTSSSFTIPWESAGGMSIQQKYEGAYSFIKRVTLPAVLGLTTESGRDPGNETDPTPISEEQLHDFQTAWDALMEGKPAATVAQKRTKFYTMFAIEQFAQLKESRFEEAMNVLRGDTK